MECSICYETVDTLNKICSGCNEFVCRLCKLKLEKYKIKNCPYCRKECEYETIYDIGTRYMFILLTSLAIIIYTSLHYVLPFVNIYYHIYFTFNEKMVLLSMLSLCFFFIQHMTIILLHNTRLISISMANITSYYALFFLLALPIDVILFTNKSKYDFIYILCGYFLIIYWVPFFLSFPIIIDKLTSFYFKYLKKINYLSITLKVYSTREIRTIIDNQQFSESNECNDCNEDIVLEETI